MSNFEDFMIEKTVKDEEKIRTIKEQALRLREALLWVRTDLSYRPPEQVDPDVRNRIISRIDSALTPE